MLLIIDREYLRKNQAGEDFGEDSFMQQNKREFGKDNAKFSISF